MQKVIILCARDREKYITSDHIMRRAKNPEFSPVG